MDNPKAISFDEWFRTNYPNQEDCDECENGKLECTECYGSGLIECEECEEKDGELICKECQSGYIQCVYCNDGYVLCEECDGTNIEEFSYIKEEYDERLIRDISLYKEIKNNDKIRRYSA